MLLCGTPAMLLRGATRVVLVHSASVGRRRTHVGWRTHVAARGYSVGVWPNILIGVWPSVLIGVWASTLIGIWPSILCCLVRHCGGTRLNIPVPDVFPPLKVP
ncbi:hypothetical protein PanWU01x14_263130 [Parasponia andersonii]|uniref:Transmembrane protein n=1 Tax=Parasponia andersonii TaxID=3476 RepID=A0A2P5B7R7_PARAD|nr:hypothetical protein PanWU01x14_263130 [Parasponia andersonii]